MGHMAIIQNADTPQIESSAVMLRAAGYDQIKVCGSALRDELKRIGCDTVLAVRQMIQMGYDALDPSITEATLEDMERCDLFCEIKVRNIPHILNRWPRLERRIAYWRVNGAQPEICPKGGDEVNLPCPIITACLWYGSPRYRQEKIGKNLSPEETKGASNHTQGDPITLEDLHRYHRELRTGENGIAYTMWPPYPRMNDYLDNARLERTTRTGYDAAYGIAHYMRSWGYGDIVSQVADLGVHLYGDRAPKGQIPHSAVTLLAQTAKAFVHLKSVDCPGWALYEAMLSGCPVITGRLLNSRMLAYDLLIDGETCYEFGVPAGLEYGRGPMELEKCLEDIRLGLEKLSDKAENRRIGEAGRSKLLDLMWSDKKPSDVESFTNFCRKNFA